MTGTLPNPHRIPMPANEAWVLSMIARVFNRVHSKWVFFDENTFHAGVNPRAIKNANALTEAVGVFDRWRNVQETDRNRMHPGTEWHVIRRAHEARFIRSAIDFTLTCPARDVFAVAIDEGHCFVRWARLENANSGDIRHWNQRKVVGTRPDPIKEVKMAAIEFDGFWRHENGTWIYFTDPWPEVCFVDEKGVLYRQFFDNFQPFHPVINFNGRQELSSSLDINFCISMCRGWLYQGSLDNDTGFFICYIKQDGFPYYRRRRWGRQPSGNDRGIREWSVEETMFFTNARPPFKKFSVARLNDLRLFFFGEDNFGNSFGKITARYLRSLLTPPIRLRGDPQIPLNAVYPIYPFIIAAGFYGNWNHAHETIITLNYPVRRLMPNIQNSFTIVDGLGITRTVREVRIWESDRRRLSLIHDPYPWTRAGWVTITFTNPPSNNPDLPFDTLNFHDGPIRILHPNERSEFSPLTTQLRIYIGDLRIIRTPPIKIRGELRSIVTPLFFEDRFGSTSPVRIKGEPKSFITAFYFPFRKGIVSSTPTIVGEPRTTVTVQFHPGGVA